MPVPHRQYVFSIPITLRKLFPYVSFWASSAAVSTRAFFFQTATGLQSGALGGGDDHPDLRRNKFMTFLERFPLPKPVISVNLFAQP